MSDKPTASAHVPLHERPPIDETIYVRVRAASIYDKDTVQLDLEIQGFFDRPGNHVVIAPYGYGVTVPAKIVPR